MFKFQIRNISLDHTPSAYIHNSELSTLPKFVTYRNYKQTGQIDKEGTRPKVRQAVNALNKNEEFVEAFGFSTNSPILSHQNSPRGKIVRNQEGVKSISNLNICDFENKANQDLDELNDLSDLRYANASQTAQHLHYLRNQQRQL